MLGQIGRQAIQAVDASCANFSRQRHNGRRPPVVAIVASQQPLDRIADVVNRVVDGAQLALHLAHRVAQLGDRAREFGRDSGLVVIHRPAG
jgi:hypothetical protein